MADKKIDGLKYDDSDDAQCAAAKSMLLAGELREWCVAISSRCTEAGWEAPTMVEHARAAAAQSYQHLANVLMELRERRLSHFVGVFVRQAEAAGLTTDEFAVKVLGIIRERGL